jgi:hypothetical protein
MKTNFLRIRFAGISWSVGLVFSALFFPSAVQAVPLSQQDQTTFLMDESPRYNGSDWLNLPEDFLGTGQKVDAWAHGNTTEYPRSSRQSGDS